MMRTPTPSSCVSSAKARAVGETEGSQGRIDRASGKLVGRDHHGRHAGDMLATLDDAAAHPQRRPRPLLATTFAHRP